MLRNLLPPYFLREISVIRTRFENHWPDLGTIADLGVKTVLSVRRFVLVIRCWQRLARVPLRRRCKHDDAKSRCLIVTLARVETLCFAAAAAAQFVALVFVVRHAYHPSPLFTLSTDRSGLTPSISREHDTLISSLPSIGIACSRVATRSLH